MLSYFLLWFPMVLLAILNGAARDLWYNKYCSELTARQISTFSLVILLGVYVYVIIKKFPPTSAAHALWLGLFWVVLTLAFEFGFGLYRGSTWNQLLDDYNIVKGHLWLLIPLWISCAPFIFYKISNT